MTNPMASPEYQAWLKSVQTLQQARAANPSPRLPAIPPAGTTPGPSTPGPTTPNSGGTGPVNLPGWDNQRTDNDPKYVFGRWVQNWINSGKAYNADAVRQFAQQDPRWELDDNGGYDPKLRVKQNELDKWKPGVSMWQDVITDSGPGGANRPGFGNVDGYGGSGTPTKAGVSPQTLAALMSALTHGQQIHQGDKQSPLVPLGQYLTSQGHSPQSLGISGPTADPAGTNPYLDFVHREQQAGHTYGDTPPQGADLEQIIANALMRAFLGA